MAGATAGSNGALSMRVRTRPPAAALAAGAVAPRSDHASTVEDLGEPFASPLALISGRLEPSPPSLLTRLRSRAAELQEAISAYVLGIESDTGDADAQLHDSRLEMIAACIACGLAGMEQGGSWSGPIPSAVAEHARCAAAAGMNLQTALRRCLAGFGLAWRLVLDEVARHDLPEEQKLALLLHASAGIESLQARVQVEIAKAHSDEIKRRTRSFEQHRADIVRRLLAGGSPDAQERAELGYELDARHIAVIATGADAGKALRCLQAGLACELLPIACGRTVSAWLGAQRKLTFEDIERVFSADGKDLSASLAIGEPARGLQGWQATHGEAEDAALVARHLPRRITRYADVAAVATALKDEALGDSLIDKYLAPLDGLGIGGQEGRRTVRALFDAEHQVCSAAHRLRKDRSTVHRRREEIQQRLNCKLQRRQADIELALRIEEWREHRDGEDASLAHRPGGAP